MSELSKSTVSGMKSLAYFLLDMFERWDDYDCEAYNVMQTLEDEGYEEYHNFWKVRIPFGWYKDCLEALDYGEEDMLVEVARIRGNHAKDLHYHKISHALCIILGPQSGFPEVAGGAVIIDNRNITAYEGLECYFPTGCKHTFHGGDDTDGLDNSNDMYFISIQSPPLLTKENDDFYWCRSEEC